jgi:hypothetical protein
LAAVTAVNLVPDRLYTVRNGWFNIIWGLEIFLLQSADAASEGKDNAMKDVTNGFDQTEEEILTYDVSDEALETAAGAEKGAWTLGACTGISVCPG